MTSTESNRRSVLAIVGPTGVGKTKLGVAIAKVLMTEVVSVDSLQVYSAGGIMTAKVTAEEMNGIKHHLVDYLPADEEPDDFFRLAYATIDDLHRRNCIPVLVGGSTSLTIPLLFDKFKPRYRILVFTLWSAESTLCSRLDDRIDEMIYNGLLSELKDIYKLEKKLLRTEVFSRGIWKAIGYREFHPYLASGGENDMLLSDGISQMKENTKLYAKAQIFWLKSRLIPLLKDQQIPQHSFEVTTSSRWQTDIEKPAIRICTDWILAKPKESICVDRVAISIRCLLFLFLFLFLFLSIVLYYVQYYVYSL
jgi:adenylate dimethylallyltransferase (cytokinin synthase)